MSWSSKGNRFLAPALIVILLGILLVLTSVSVEENYHPSSHLVTIPLNFLVHLGIALFSLGIIGFFLERRHWSDYFIERLGDTIKKREYLLTVEKDELKSLLKDVLQAYYRGTKLAYEGNSFLEFFNTKIQDYIASPFREDTRAFIDVERPRSDGSCVVDEEIVYKCRRIDDASCIQNEVSWAASCPDIIKLLDYSVCLQLPEQEKLPTNFSLASSFAKDKEDRICFGKDDPRLVPPVEGYGFNLSIRDLKDVDELQVRIHLKYVIPVGRFFARVMPILSRGFDVVFHYPHEFEIIVEYLGMDERKQQIINRPGFYSLTYDSWILPDNGLAYQFRQKSFSQNTIARDNIAAEESDANGFLRKEVEASEPSAEAVVEKVTSAREFDDTIVKESYHQFSDKKVGK
jgi:hypothetical protein